MHHRIQKRAWTGIVNNEFVLPYLDIRDRTLGYAVSIVTACLPAVGRRGGPVRPPLTNLHESEIAELRDLIGRIA